MAKRRTRRATAKRRTATNPTRRRKTYRRRTNPTNLGSKLKGLDLKGILVEGAAVAAGSLATSFVNRQAARIFPTMNPTLRTGLSGLLTAGVLAYFSKGRGVIKSMAVGSAANAFTSMAATVMPGTFSGLEGEEEYALQGWDPSDGTWTEDGLGDAGDEAEMAGVLFDRNGYQPSNRNF